MSSPTAQTEPKVIHLTYDTKSDRVTSEPPEPIHFHPGDLIEFESVQGPVTVELHPPHAYKPSVYHTGSDPVRVIDNVGGTLWCVIFNTTAGANSPRGYPKNQRYGINVRP